jgi:DNA repair exonuclease SbcCD ATPase subunit
MPTSPAPEDGEKSAPKPVASTSEVREDRLRLRPLSCVTSRSLALLARANVRTHTARFTLAATRGAPLVRSVESCTHALNVVLFFVTAASLVLLVQATGDAADAAAAVSPSPSERLSPLLTVQEDSDEVTGIDKLREKRARLLAMRNARKLEASASEPSMMSSTAPSDGDSSPRLERPRSDSTKSGGSGSLARGRSDSIRSGGSPVSSPSTNRRVGKVRDLAVLTNQLNRAKAHIATLTQGEADARSRITTLERKLEEKSDEIRSERAKRASAEEDTGDSGGRSEADNAAFRESEEEITRLRQNAELAAEAHAAELAAAAEEAELQRERADEAAEEVDAMRAQIEQLRDLLMANGSANLPENWFELLMERTAAGGTAVAGTGASAENPGDVAEYEAALEEAYAELEELRAVRGRVTAERCA